MKNSPDKLTSPRLPVHQGVVEQVAAGWHRDDWSACVFPKTCQAWRGGLKVFGEGQVGQGGAAGEVAGQGGELVHRELAPLGDVQARAQLVKVDLLLEPGQDVLELRKQIGGGLADQGQGLDHLLL